jgi:hypothetical protein
MAVAAVFGLGLTGFKFQNTQWSFGNRFKTVSDSEANQYFSKMDSSEVKQIKPEPPPKSK